MNQINLVLLKRNQQWDKDDDPPPPQQHQQSSSASPPFPLPPFTSCPSTTRLLAGSPLRANHYLLTSTFDHQQEPLVAPSSAAINNKNLLFSPSTFVDPSTSSASCDDARHAHDRRQYYYRLAASLNKVYDATVSCRAELLLLNEKNKKADTTTEDFNTTTTIVTNPPLEESPKEQHLLEPTKNNRQEPHTKNHEQKRSLKKFEDRLEELLAHKRTHGALDDISPTGQTLPLYKWCSDVRTAFGKKLRNEPDRRLRRFTDKHFRALFEIGFDYRLPDCDDYFPEESVTKRKKSLKNGRNIEDDMKNLSEYDFISIASGDSSFHLSALQANDIIPEPVPSSSLNVQGIETHESNHTYHPMSTNIQFSRVAAKEPPKKKAKSSTTGTSYLKFNQRICDLEAYKIEHGTLFNLTKRYRGYRSLGAWVAEVRLAYKKRINGFRSRSKINDDQFRQLYEIGFDFKENCTKRFGLESDLKREKAIAEAKLRYEERKRRKETPTEVATEKGLNTF